MLPSALLHAGDYRAGDLLVGKYSVISVMGRGGNSVTYKVGW